MLSIPAAARRTKCKAATIVQWILDRRLRWVGKQAGLEKYASLLVDLSEIESHAYAVEGDYVTILEAVTLLRTHRPVVDNLIHEGYLTYEVMELPSNHLRTKMIKRSAIHDFMDTYISLHRLAEDKGLHFRHILKWLGETNPAIDRDLIGTTFYRRDSVPRF